MENRVYFDMGNRTNVIHIPNPRNRTVSYPTVSQNLWLHRIVWPEHLLYYLVLPPTFAEFQRRMEEAICSAFAVPERILGSKK